mmetsp:Transcript_9240/g.14995  ORF Transcript_9240/g.14995 Transcript_9240/m.14995 type:complete len:749 (+) Transcript_9240:89-2335(+)
MGLHVHVGKLGRNVVRLGRGVSRSLSTGSASYLDSMRNIGILAHIDAGKTTVTERMLFFCGEVNSTGEVHDGDTVMDYLDQERERGITINSAATTFKWRESIFNLIDTPGHVDFTVEVERAVRVMDGAVAVIDAVAGVQAQTETVWGQAARYKVPRIAFVNKMDRDGANFIAAAKSLEKRLGALPLLTQLPCFRGDRLFRGVVNLLDGQLHIWSQEKGDRDFMSEPLMNSQDDDLLKVEALKYREELVEQLADLDEEFGDVYLERSMEAECGDLASHIELFPAEEIKPLLRKVTLNQYETRAVPVFCGSALKNTGVQLVMDGVVDYLPKPLVLQGETNFKALAFKVQHDTARGPLVFVRVYSGVLESRGVYHVISPQCKGAKKERANQVLRAFANDFEQVERVVEGDIGIVVGLKHTRTGDTITDTPKKTVTPLDTISIPAPVFSTALELETAADEPKLVQALNIMTRDDPSLSVVENEETGQLVLYGMGELHLEVAHNKLLRDFKVECEMGRVQVAYRETYLGEAQSTGVHQVAGADGSNSVTKLTLRVSPHEGGVNAPATVAIKKKAMVKHPESGELVALSEEQTEGISDGISKALNSGPILGYPLQGIAVELVESESEASPKTAASILQGAALRAMSNFMSTPEAVPNLLEPLVSIEIVVPDDYIGAVIGDLTNIRRGLVDDVQAQENVHGTRQKSIIYAKVPLEGLIGYSTAIRSTTAGEGSFSTNVDGYKLVTASELEKIKLI